MIDLIPNYHLQPASGCSKVPTALPGQYYGTKTINGPDEMKFDAPRRRNRSKTIIHKIDVFVEHEQFWRLSHNDDVDFETTREKTNRR